MALTTSLTKTKKTSQIRTKIEKRVQPFQKPFPMSSHIPEKVLELTRQVQAIGGRALLVGGCVRDRLMGAQAKEWDVEVYQIEPARLRAWLERHGRVDAVGEAFA